MYRISGHILGHKERFPLEYMNRFAPKLFKTKVSGINDREKYLYVLEMSIRNNDDSIARFEDDILERIKKTISEALRHKKLAIPYYCICKENAGVFLPFRVEGRELALAIAKQENGKPLVVSVYPKRYAYQVARLVGELKGTWLENPYKN